MTVRRDVLDAFNEPERDEISDARVALNQQSLDRLEYGREFPSVVRFQEVDKVIGEGP
jgi:hypothetical protein